MQSRCRVSEDPFKEPIHSGNDWDLWSARGESAWTDATGLSRSETIWVAATTTLVLICLIGAVAATAICIRRKNKDAVRVLHRESIHRQPQSSPLDHLRKISIKKVNGQTMIHEELEQQQNTDIEIEDVLDMVSASRDRSRKKHET